MDDSWTDSNLNRVSVIQFQEETKAEEEEDDEAAAARRVGSTRYVVASVLETDRGIWSKSNVLFMPQGLHRRATPHPSELKVMKKVIEDRRNEAYTSRPDGEEEALDSEVR